MTAFGRVLWHDPFYPSPHRSALRRRESPRLSTLPLPSRRVNLARLFGNHRFARLLERLEEQFGWLGTGKGDATVHDEERHARYPEAPGFLLPGPDDIQPSVALKQFAHFLLVKTPRDFWDRRRSLDL